MKNLGSTVELLAVSETEFVREWDPQTVDRAFQWAIYCEHVYSRFHSNSSIRPVLEESLRLTNQRLSEALPEHCHLSLDDLAQCGHRLLITLLRNPVAPCSVIKSILDKFRLFEDDTDTKQATEAGPDLPGLIRCRAACKLFSSFPLNPKETSGLEIGTQVQGLMLLQRIHAVHSHPGNDSYARTILDSILQHSGDLDQFSKVITASLLIEDSTSEDTAAQGFLLDWLQGRHGLHHHMCQALPAELCTRLSQQWPKFWLLYWAVLKKWASSLEYDVNSCVWIQQSESTPSFKALVDRFRSLWDSGSELKQETEKELVALKKTDGDFDVQGLSVWTDLLLHLK